MHAGPAALLALALVAALRIAPAQDQGSPESAQEMPHAEEPAEEIPDAQTYLAPLLEGKDAASCLQRVSLDRPQLPGQQPVAASAPPKLRRLVLAIDSSGSMRAVVGGERKIEAAKRAAVDFLADVPADVEIGLLVFGHKGSSRPAGKAESCAGVETLYDFGPANREAIRTAIAGLKASGWTPLAAAVDKAAALFKPADNAGEQVLYVVSDGVETCGGNPVGAARRLRQSAVRAVVNIIGFDIDAKERAGLQAVAEAGGGRFLEARTGQELDRRLREQLASQARATGARLAAGAAETNARLAVGSAVTNARLCIGALETNERLRVGSALTRDAMAGRIDPELQKEVNRLLSERHARLDALLEDYAKALEAMEAEHIAAIEQDLRRALAAP